MMRFIVLLTNSIAILLMMSSLIHGQTLNAFTTLEKESIVEKHNDVRLGTLNPPAASMGTLVWEEELAQVAANYADKCLFDHNKDRTSEYGKGYVGENLYISVGVSDIVGGSVKSWHDEVQFFTYPNTCQQGEVCGHYTQLIWENSKKVGCARKTCPTVSGYPQFNGGTIVVCNYFPGGNINGVKPYVQRIQEPQLSTNGTISVSPSNSTSNLATTSMAPSNSTTNSIFLLANSLMVIGSIFIIL